MGHTGAGKTTIISLLLRFYDPERGRITIDGVDIRDLDPADLRGLIGFVQQDLFLFTGDILRNLVLDAAVGPEVARAAAGRVGADRFIERLPGGYGHVLGERGRNLSVGERQLLSFARALARDPRILVLDEATSSVDAEAELQMQRAVGELMLGRTSLVVAHRLSTILHADEILVLHHGEIRERGTHRSLLARGGLYERLYRLQLRGQEPPPGSERVSPYRLRGYMASDTFGIPVETRARLMMELEFAAQRTPIPMGELVIGADPSCGLRLTGVAAAHAVVVGASDGSASVRRVGDNDVLLNGVKLGAEPAPILHGDKVQVGIHELLVHDPRRSGSTQFVSASDVAKMAAAVAAKPASPKPRDRGDRWATRLSDGRAGVHHRCRADRHRPGSGLRHRGPQQGCLSTPRRDLRIAAGVCTGRQQHQRHLRQWRPDRGAAGAGAGRCDQDRRSRVPFLRR